MLSGTELANSESWSAEVFAGKLFLAAEGLQMDQIMKTKFQNARRKSGGRIATQIAAMAVVLLPLLVFAARAQNARTETELHRFRGGTDGNLPDPQLIRDAAGNLYGTTQYGGVPTCGQNIGCGTVFQIGPSGKETVLYAFTSGTDGSNPTGGVVRDAAGNLYGVASDEADDNGGAYGSVFRLEPSGKLVTLYAFTGGPDGGLPTATVIRDSAGHLYGTTYSGGAFGAGTVYKVDPSGHETVLYSFMGGADGSGPQAPVIRDQAGNLYGTTPFGGELSCDCGTVFKIDTSGIETALYRFTNGTDGAYPAGGLIQDQVGNLYGGARLAGDSSCNPPYGCGTVFKLDSSGNFTVLHTFTGGLTDGASPAGALTLDAYGNLYGATSSGGVPCPGIAYGCGTVFKLDSTGNETLLHIFAEGHGDGLVPYAGVLRADGNLFGTTSLAGGQEHLLYGTVYEISAN
jgi:uncharacterized repeat protein (TIGR03803 family)